MGKLLLHEHLFKVFTRGEINPLHFLVVRQKRRDCGVLGVPAIYTNVEHYASWISGIVAATS